MTLCAPCGSSSALTPPRLSLSRCDILGKASLQSGCSLTGRQYYHTRRKSLKLLARWLPRHRGARNYFETFRACTSDILGSLVVHASAIYWAPVLALCRRILAEFERVTCGISGASTSLARNSLVWCLLCDHNSQSENVLQPQFDRISRCHRILA